MELLARVEGCERSEIRRERDAFSTEVVPRQPAL